MEPKKYKKINIPTRRGAQQRNQAKLNKAQAYANEAPTIGNLYNAFVNWLTGTSWLAGESDYITGTAPAGGRKFQLLNPQQIRNLQLRTLRHKNVKAYNDAVNRITEKDAVRQMIKERANDPNYQDAIDDYAATQNDILNSYEDLNNGFDPEMEWLEYKYGGTDTYDLMYNKIANRRGWEPKPIDWGYWK